MPSFKVLHSLTKPQKYLDMLMNIQILKVVHAKLLLECEDETLNKLEIFPDDKKVTCEKSNCLIHMISSVFICLLLSAVISFGCCYY